MANRVILGKSTNSNLGHSGGKFGLYISRTGDDITNCTKDQLIFNTDNVGFNSGAVDVGQFQIVPSSGTNATVSVSANASASATVPIVNIGTGHFIYSKFSGSYGGGGSSGSSGNELTSRFLNGGFSGATSATVTNGGNSAITVTVSIVKGFSTQSLY
jgi:hypothetical protein|tara:strand:- start:65 stop:538 length:474 start_codon:yes stop_codon:yes gene_type:complete